MKKEKIISIIEEFAAKIDPEIEVIPGLHFASNILTKTVAIGIGEFFEESPDWPMHFMVMREMGYPTDLSLPIYSILHEIGHVVSADYYDNVLTEMALYELSLRSIARMGLDPLDELRVYKNLKLEKDADLFATDFYERYPEKIEELERRILDLI